MQKAEEEAAVLEEPGVIRDIDIANIVYTIPDVGDEPTSALELDEAMKYDTDTDSDVSIEPYMIQGTE